MKINQVKMKQKCQTLIRHPGSLILFLVTMIAAVVTVFVLGYLIVYILVHGIPH